MTRLALSYRLQFFPTLAQIKQFRGFENGIACSCIMGNAMINLVGMQDETTFAERKTWKINSGFQMQCLIISNYLL